MSCGCTSTTTASPSVTCGSCGYQCTSCICPPDSIVMPTVTCSDPVECLEIYPAACVQYTGNDIKCSTADSSYPNVTHIVAANGDMLPDILNNINSQLCYLFSDDFIIATLNVIDKNSELQDLLCSLITNCSTHTAGLICPTVSSVTYNVNNTGGQNYLTAVFNYVPYATNYAYQFYVETVVTGVYTLISGCGGNIPQPSVALPISVSGLLDSTYTANKNYAVLVYATDATGLYTPNGVNPATNNPSFTYDTVAASHLNNCGINKYTASGDTTQTCSLDPLHTADIKNVPNQTSLLLQFTFVQLPTIPPSYIQISSYKIHWYLQKTIPNISYDYQGNFDINSSSTPALNPAQLTYIHLWKLPVSATYTKSGYTVTITSTNHGMVTNQAIKIDTGVTGVPSGEYTIVVVNSNSFNIGVSNNTPGSGPITYKSSFNPNVDKVVVMVQTLTADPTCSNGVAPRTNGSFTPTEIATYTANPQYQVYKNF